MNDVKGILDYIEILLRYVVSGIISVVTIGYLDEQACLYIRNLLQQSPWGLVAITGIVGLLTYALHQAVFDKLWYSLSLKLYLRIHKIPDELKKQIENGLQKTLKQYSVAATFESDIIGNLRFGLFTQTYLRRCSQRVEIIRMQKEMDKKLALLNFIYCALYSVVIIALLCHLRFSYIYGYQLSTDMYKYHFHAFRFWGVLALGLALLAGALWYDYRITKREMWAVEFFFQPLVSINKTIEFRLPRLGSETMAILKGSFDNWTSARSMSIENGVWVYRAEMPAGDIKYKYFINDVEITGNELESFYWDEANHLFSRTV